MEDDDFLIDEVSIMDEEHCADDLEVYDDEENETGISEYLDEIDEEFPPFEEEEEGDFNFKDDI